MRFLFIFLLGTVLFAFPSQAQFQAVSKIYIVNPNRSLRPATAARSALEIKPVLGTGYTLIETDMDSLALISPRGQTVYLLVEPGKTYYYGQDYNSFLFQDISPNAFWLSVAAGSGSYRHYSITRKSGLVELKQSNR